MSNVTHTIEQNITDLQEDFTNLDIPDLTNCEKKTFDDIDINGYELKLTRVNDGSKTICMMVNI